MPLISHLLGLPLLVLGFLPPQTHLVLRRLWQRKMWSLRQKLNAQLLLGRSQQAEFSPMENNVEANIYDAHQSYAASI